MEEMEEIEGKVAKIMDEYTVVINRGSEHRVEEDMRFVIYEPGDEIKDPDTDKSLGKFEHVKAKVEVVNVQEKFSTAKTYETHTMTMPAIQQALAQVSGQTTRNELPLDEETRAGLQKGLRPLVKIGDLVRQILD
jgi:hypothetical protein